MPAFLLMYSKKDIRSKNTTSLVEINGQDKNAILFGIKKNLTDER